MRMMPRVRLLIPGLLFLFTTIYIYIFLSSNVKPTVRNIRVKPTPDNTLKSSQPYRSPSRNLPPVQWVNRSGLLGLSHQVLQRRALRFVRESRYLLGSKLRSWKAAGTLPPGEELLLERFEELSRYLEVTVEGLARVDGASAAQKMALKELGENLQSQLHALQHPPNCDQARLLVMDINKLCGFGCQIHHVVHCFVLAYATNRTLLLSNNKWSYSNHGFTSVFEDLSSCPASVAGSTVSWGHAGFGSARAVFCPIVEHVHPLPSYAHPAVPAALAYRLAQLHGAPHVWFVGQLLAYVMRPSGGQESPELQQALASMRSSDPRKDIVVGLHVRRTDKIKSEASFHGLDEYMFYVEEYFKKREAERLLMRRKHEWFDDDTEIPDEQPSSAIKRRVLITTDDASVFAEAQRKYPNYEFIGDSQRAKSAELSSRYTHDALVAVITDVVALSHTDYLVCTFSSQICRLAYELMQTRVERLGDASACFQSLDDVYYYGGQQAWPYEVLIPDERSDLKVGDLVTFHGNHWDGMAKVSALASGSSKALLVPAYKFQQRLLAVPFGPSPLDPTPPPSPPPSRLSLNPPAV